MAAMTTNDGGDPVVLTFFLRERGKLEEVGGLDPSRLKAAGGRLIKHKPEVLLKCLGNDRLRTTEWSRLAKEEFGVPVSRFFELIKSLEEEEKVHKSAVDGKWEQIRPNSQNL
jgi:hypothetical protein